MNTENEIAEGTYLTDSLALAFLSWGMSGNICPLFKVPVGSALSRQPQQAAVPNHGSYKGDFGIDMPQTTPTKHFQNSCQSRIS